MISNPQSLNRLGHFLTPDFKSGGTPSGLAFLFYIRRDANRPYLFFMVLPPSSPYLYQCLNSKNRSHRAVVLRSSNERSAIGSRMACG